MTWAAPRSMKMVEAPSWRFKAAGCRFYFIFWAERRKAKVCNDYSLSFSWQCFATEHCPNLA
jgi:hypothetical protein